MKATYTDAFKANQGQIKGQTVNNMYLLSASIMYVVPFGVFRSYICLDLRSKPMYTDASKPNKGYEGQVKGQIFLVIYI